MDVTQEDETYIQEAIQFFAKLIHRRKYELRIDTRPVNFAGNIGRQMTKNLKKWFLNKYPNNSDYVKFFLENDNVFHYDYITGDVSVITAPDQSFVASERRKQLEDFGNNPDIDLRQMSRNVFELELLIVTFKTFVDSLSLRKTIELKTSYLAEQLCEPKYERMFRQLADIVADPKTNGAKFEVDLMAYLDDNYSEVFAVNKKSQTIRLQLQVIESLKKVSDVIDDSIYNIFRDLLVKFLEKNGPRDVDVLYAAIKERHQFIVDHIFGNSQITGDDYTLLDFCKSFGDTFELNRTVGTDGLIQRLISIRKPQVKAEPEPTAAPFLDDDPFLDEIWCSEDSDDELYVSEEEEEILHINGVKNDVIDSDDEIYCSDEEEVSAAVAIK